MIIDANAIWQLEDPVLADRLIASCQAADLAIHPTAVNIVELVRIANVQRRNRLLHALARVTQNRNVLPEPMRFLQWIGGMISRGESSFLYPPSGHEPALRNPAAIPPHYVVRSSKVHDALEREFEQRHRLGRSTIRGLLKKKGVLDPWGSSVAFLDQQWTKRDLLDSFIEKYWSHFQLPGPAPIDAVLANEAWRLAFEGLGATVYERAIASQTTQPAHANDIDQLVYLAGNPRRILVTDDAGLRRVASDILKGRYHGSRVISVSEFVAQAS